jgi:hypothetical protein
MANWNANIDARQPCWDGYRELLARLDGACFPDAESLEAVLPPGAVSGGGAPICFVAAGQLPGVAYERHIFETGQVSTREDNWHDLFNALAWCRLPRFKAAMNALHYHNLAAARQGRRGTARDALTLLDESGALVVSRHRALLEALAARDWSRAFLDLRDAWKTDSHIVICGHALLEKLLAPYKSITAHVLLLQVDTPAGRLRADRFLPRLDEWLGNRLPAGGLCDTPAALSPLPLAGVPGWWSETPQDSAFYADVIVFRPPPAELQPAVVQLLPPALFSA